MPNFEVHLTRGRSAPAVAEPLYPEEDGHFIQFKYSCPPSRCWPSRPRWSRSRPRSAIWLALRGAGARAYRAEHLPVCLTVWPPWLLAHRRIVLMGKFYGHELVLGQVNLLFAVIVSVGVLLAATDRGVGAGGLFALAVIIKPYAVLFLPWLAAQGASGRSQPQRESPSSRSSCRFRSTAGRARSRSTWIGGAPSRCRRRRTCSTPTTAWHDVCKMDRKWHHLDGPGRRHGRRTPGPRRGDLSDAPRTAPPRRTRSRTPVGPDPAAIAWGWCIVPDRHASGDVRRQLRPGPALQWCASARGSHWESSPSRSTTWWESACATYFIAASVIACATWP